MSWEQRFRMNARCYVNTYIRRGVIERQPCERGCDQPAAPHHDDYRKPLEIRWLCRAHRAEWIREHGPGLMPEGPPCR